MAFIFGLIRRLIKFTVYFLLFAVIVTIIPNWPPYTNFTRIEIEPTLPRVGPLSENAALNNAEPLYNKKVVGPETFQLYKGEVYTGLGTGEVVKLSPGGHVTFVTKIGKPCEGIAQEPKCGRPLGMAIDEKNNQLYVVDAYYGIWKVDLKTDKKQLLVSPDVEIGGHEPRLFNSIALAKNGDFYWTHSSSEFGLNEGVLSAFADPSGRLLYYNAAKNESTVLLDGLWFANGVAMSPDKQFLVVAESSRYRLLKYYIDGPKKGKSEVFLAGLPGLPDNLRALPDGSGLQVALYVVFDEETPLLVKSMAKTPVVRKFLARMITLAMMPFDIINSNFPNIVIEDIANNIASFKTFAAFIPNASALLQVDWSGNIVASYYNTDGSLGHVSDAIVFKDKLYTGSPHGQDFVGSVPAPPLLRKAYAGLDSTPPPKTAETVTKPIPQDSKPKVQEKKEVPKAAKPTQAPPKPTQAPPKPTQAPPKPTQAPPKPTQAPPKPTQAPPKPTQAPPKPSAKPAEAKVKPEPAKPKPTEPVTAAPPKQEKPGKVTTPKPAEPAKVTPPKPAEKQATVDSQKPKPATQTTPPPPKQAEKTSTAKSQSETKTAKSAKTEKTQETTPNPKQSQNTKPEDKPVKPKEIPIKEEIPSDTVKPSKETLKVIKKGGPTEIPNPL